MNRIKSSIILILSLVVTTNLWSQNLEDNIIQEQFVVLKQIEFTSDALTYSEIEFSLIISYPQNRNENFEFSIEIDSIFSEYNLIKGNILFKELLDIKANCKYIGAVDSLVIIPSFEIDELIRKNNRGVFNPEKNKRIEINENYKILAEFFKSELTFIYPIMFEVLDWNFITLKPYFELKPVEFIIFEELSDSIGNEYQFSFEGYSNSLDSFYNSVLEYGELALTEYVLEELRRSENKYNNLPIEKRKGVRKSDFIKADKLYIEHINKFNRDQFENHKTHYSSLEKTYEMELEYHFHSTSDLPNYAYEIRPTLWIDIEKAIDFKSRCITEVFRLMN